MILLGYTWFPWMKGKSILGKAYKPTNEHFPKYLTRAKNEIFIPSESKDPLMECIHKALYGNIDNLKLDENNDYDRYCPVSATGQRNIRSIAIKYELRIDIYTISSVIGGKEIAIKQKYEAKNYKHKIALLSNCSAGWGWIMPGM